MTDLLTPEQREGLAGIRKAVQDIKLHDHERREDWFCMNLTGWLGERSGWLVARLDEAHAEVASLNLDLAAMRERVRVLGIAYEDHCCCARCTVPASS